MIWNTFSYTYESFTCLLWQNVFSCLLLTLKTLLFLFLELEEFFGSCEYYSFIPTVQSEAVFSCLWLVFSFPYCCLLMQKRFFFFSLHCFLINVYLLLGQGEKAHPQEWGNSRKRGRRKIQSRLCPERGEPDEGLDPTSWEIMTWATVRHLTDWATQAPHKRVLNFKQLQFLNFCPLCTVLLLWCLRTFCLMQIYDNFLQNSSWNFILSLLFRVVIHFALTAVYGVAERKSV